MVVLVILAVWFLSLAAFVALKARQPKLVYPRPPLVERANWDDYVDAA